MELVSIVIPTYNRADVLSLAINSALKQTYKNIETIVIDDGSTDKTLELCLIYGGLIRYVRKNNGGIGSALNRGILEMHGEWFKWLSSDDYLESDAVEKLLNRARENRVKIVYSSYKMVNIRNEVVGYVKETEKDYFGFASELVKRHVGNGSSILIHRSCFDRVGTFDEGLRAGEDYDWWMRACFLFGYEFRCVQDFLLNYRVHSGQLTESFRTRALENQYFIRNRVLKQVKEKNPRFYRWLVKQQYPRDVRGNLRFIRRKFLRALPESFKMKLIGIWFKFLKR